MRGLPHSEAIGCFAKSPRVFLVFFCQTMMTMGMECQALLPLYLQQGAGLTAAAAGPTKPPSSPLVMWLALTYHRRGIGALSGEVVCGGCVWGGGRGG